MESTLVYFTCLEKAIRVNEVLASFTLPFVGTQVTIRWYGAIIAVGFLLAVLFGGRTAYKWKMNLDKMVDVLIYGTFGGIIGARLYYVVFHWDYYANNLSEIYKLWNGGLAIYGGIIGGLLAAYITCRIRKLNFRNLLDCASMSLLIGQGIGRWGNFANQEAFGTNTTLPWGMLSSKTTEYLMSVKGSLAADGITVDPYAPVHPTFLYESIWCLLGFLLLFFVCKKCIKFSGELFLIYGIWYGAGRAVFEGLRTDSLYIANTSIRVSQVLSVAIVAVCLCLLILTLRRLKKNPKPIEGVDFFPDADVKKKAEKKSASKQDLQTLAQKRMARQLGEDEAESNAASPAEIADETSETEDTPAEPEERILQDKTENEETLPENNDGNIE